MSAAPSRPEALRHCGNCTGSCARSAPGCGWRSPRNRHGSARRPRAPPGYRDQPTCAAGRGTGGWLACVSLILLPRTLCPAWVLWQLPDLPLKARHEASLPAKTHLTAGALPIVDDAAFHRHQERLLQATGRAGTVHIGLQGPSPPGPGQVRAELPVDPPAPRDQITTKKLPGFMHLRTPPGPRSAGLGGRTARQEPEPGGPRVPGVEDNRAGDDVMQRSALDGQAGCRRTQGRRGGSSAAVPACALPRGARRHRRRPAARPGSRAAPCRRSCRSQAHEYAK